MESTEVVYDPTLLRKPDEEDEFSALFIEDEVGLGIFESAEEARKILGIPNEMDFRITVHEARGPVKGQRAHIWVRLADLQGRKNQEKKAAKRSYMEALPEAVGILIAVSLSAGVLFAFWIWVINGVFALQGSTMTAFLFGFGIIAALCLIAFVRWTMDHLK